MKTLWVYVNFHLNCEGKAITKSHGKYVDTWSASKSVAQGLKESTAYSHYLVTRKEKAFIMDDEVYILFGQTGWGELDEPELIKLGSVEDSGNPEAIKEAALKKLTPLELSVLGLIDDQ
jgi:hypothetical protein